MEVTLDDNERAELFKQEPSTAGDGGFQSLLVSLQSRISADNVLELTPADLERIPRYAFDYGNGGWENTLKAIFSTHLGPHLGR